MTKGVLTISVGVATAERTTNALTAEHLMAQSDEALYLTKRQARNQAMHLPVDNGQ